MFLHLYTFYFPLLQISFSLVLMVPQGWVGEPLTRPSLMLHPAWTCRLGFQFALSRVHFLSIDFAFSPTLSTLMKTHHVGLLVCINSVCCSFVPTLTLSFCPVSVPSWCLRWISLLADRDDDHVCCAGGERLACPLLCQLRFPWQRKWRSPATWSSLRAEVVSRAVKVDILSCSMSEKNCFQLSPIH